MKKVRRLIMERELQDWAYLVDINLRKGKIIT